MSHSRPPQPLWQHVLHTFIFRRLPGVLLGLLIGFGVVLAAQAQEPEACGFGLVECDDSGVVWNFPALGPANLAQLGANDGIAEFITAFGFFLNRQIVPLLFAFAFFFFLYYVARFFILDRANEKDREEAKQRALWGLGAFVFFVSIWGIVNLLVAGFGLQRSQSLCPDYLGSYCGDIDLRGGTNNPFAGTGSPRLEFFDGAISIGFSNRGGSNFQAFDPNDGGFVAFQPGNDTTVRTTATESSTGIVELMYGTNRDDAGFDFGSTAPAAANSVVTIDPAAQCINGITALQTSARFETLQAAYAYRRTVNGETGWTNLTNRSTENFVAFDANFLNTTRPVAEHRTALVHTHQQSMLDNLNFSGSGYAPSANDMRLLCDGVNDDAQIVVVDGRNVWVIDSVGATCPRRAVDDENLEIISVLAQLSVTDTNVRNDALSELLSTDRVPSRAQDTLAAYSDIDLRTLSSAQLMVAADSLAREGDMRIRRLTPADFCAQFEN